MDGKNRTVLHNTALRWPNALTLDYQSQILYWADASLDKIESSNVDGSNRILLSTVGVDHPYGMAVFGNTLYFTDWNGPSVKAMNISGGNATAIFGGVLCTQLFGIAVVSEQKQPIGMYKINMVATGFLYVSYLLILTIQYLMHAITMEDAVTFVY